MANEKRLIDANEALRMIKDSQEDNPFLNIRGQGEIWKGAHDNAIDCVNTCPTVDAEPVVHGRWVAKETMIRSPFAENYYCSECKTEGSPQWKRCPVCEAKMDGGSYETN